MSAQALEMMKDWIEEHITENPSLQAMADAVGYSPFYCSSQFHRYTGMTYKQYLAAHRIAFAKVLLRESPDKILDIACRSGFSSQEAFTRAFVKAVGCTPGVYRREGRAGQVIQEQGVCREEPGGAREVKREVCEG